MINCYAFAAVPPIVQGLVRDLRVRWALEETGIPYRVTLVDRVGDGGGAMPLSDYRRIQPFGQIPAIEDGDLTLFESGACVQYVAEKAGKLLGSNPTERLHVVQWMFAALNSIEPPVQELAMIDLAYAGQGWAAERRPALVDWVRTRLGQLAGQLEGKEHLVGAFSAADLLMVSVLRMLKTTELVAEQPVLAAYHRRCEARPAFQRALDGQMSAFKAA
jgi:glutathione S-transferase